ncbi:DUF3558 domain-containing protein [Prauserella muralis]|uniref:DUF3558 domain-containing protein n=1 Tax=Prauserella muralis TaxID=588067 RepID=UPI001FE33E11|nr:DUF3558 domain-containing protein [Prauserella muralis]
MSTRRSLALLGCAAVLLTGCTSTEGGTPSPASGDRARPSEPQRRPAELSLEGVDPCTLFTGAQLDELKVNSVPRTTDEGRDGPTCSLDADRTPPYHSFYVEAVPADLREWIDGDRHKDVMTSDSIDVLGFPALVTHARDGAASDCETLVGVAEGHTLRTQMYPLDPSAFTQRQMCDLATRVATLAVQNLQATR